MTHSYCVHCGLLLPDYRREPCIHAMCLPDYTAEQAAEARRPKTSMQQQLDRIEGLLMAIRDRYSL